MTTETGHNIFQGDECTILVCLDAMLTARQVIEQLEEFVTKARDNGYAVVAVRPDKTAERHNRAFVDFQKLTDQATT